MSCRKLCFVFAVAVAAAQLFFSAESFAVEVGRGADEGKYIRLKNFLINTEGGFSSLKPSNTSGPDFYILQFSGPVLESWKDEISSLGVRFYGYIPDNAFIVKMTPSQVESARLDRNVKWIGLNQPGYKLQKKLYNKLMRLGGVEVKKLTVKVFDDEDIAPVVSRIEKIGGKVEVVSDAPGLGGKLLRATIADASAQIIGNIPQVEWVEEYNNPVLFNDLAAGPAVMDVTPVWSLPTPLTGTGQVVGVLDTGLDTGNTGTMHPGFSGPAGNGNPKIKSAYSVNYRNAWSDLIGHGTHVAGSVTAKPFGSYSIKGVAYDAELVFMSCADQLGLLIIPDLNTVVFPQAYGLGVRVVNNSWGSSTYGDYNSDCVSTDTFVWNNKDFVVLFAAGNAGVDANSDGVVDQGSINPPGTAKNIISVGACENNRPAFSSTYGGSWPSDYPADPLKSDRMADNPGGMVAFSSRGPTADGRIKPDVIAPGTWVLSTRSSMAPTGNYWAMPSAMGLPSAMDAYFGFMGGTSMATPLTTGAAALVRQYYTDIIGLNTPSAALIKAALINGATDIQPGQYGTGATQDVKSWPDYNQGFGRVDLAGSVAPAAPYRMYSVDDGIGVGTSETKSFTYTVADASVSVRATLVWTDYVGTAGSGKELVNDLDLKVVTPDVTEFHGNSAVPNPGAGVYDSVNNVESVAIPVQYMSKGALTVSVTGHNVPMGVSGRQPFAVVIKGGLADNTDALAPISQIISPADGALINGSVTSGKVTGTASDSGSGVKQVDISLNGGTSWLKATGTTSWYYNVPSIPADGSYKILSRATDIAGNIETPGQGITVTVDKIKPASVITYPVNNSTVSGASVAISGTANDALSGVKTVEISINNGAWRLCSGTGSWSYTVASPPNGTYSIKARATDNAGNVESPTVTVTVTVKN